MPGEEYLMECQEKKKFVNPNEDRPAETEK